MTGSAEKCFSMNGGERCIMAIIIFRKGGGLGEGWWIVGPDRRAGGFILIIFGHFFKLVFQAVFWRSLFHIFNDFCVPMGSQIGVFWDILSAFLWSGDFGKTVLSLQSQHDSAGSRASRIRHFPCVFQVMFLSVFLWFSFVDFLWFLVIWGVPLELVWCHFGEPKSQRKALFFFKAPRRVPGRD